MSSSNSRIVDPAAVEAVRRRDGCCLWGLVAQDGCMGMLDVHHLDKRSQGGSDVGKNLIVLCRRHHGLAEANKILKIDLLRVMARFHGFEYEELK